MESIAACFNLDRRHPFMFHKFSVEFQMHLQLCFFITNAYVFQSPSATVLRVYSVTFEVQ